MNLQNVPELLRRLRAIPRYRELFAKAFGANSRQTGATLRCLTLRARWRLTSAG
jgi:hypothetical protein